jgi:ABC-type nitrate/sulfonate/bicarbonate transport system permease component
VLRSASPQIVTGMRQALSIGIILMVISEMFAASSGLGFAIVQFHRAKRGGHPGQLTAGR